MAEVQIDEELLTIELSEPLPDKPTLTAPSIAWSGTPFEVTGTTPNPNQEVWIELNQLLTDEELEGSRTTSDSSGKFTTTITLEGFGSKTIHAEVPALLLNPVSANKTVWVLDYMILGLIVVVIILLWWMMKGKGGKK